MNVGTKLTRAVLLTFLCAGCPSEPPTVDAAVAVDAALPSDRDAGARCPTTLGYPAGRTTSATLEHGGRTRSFRVHVPPGLVPGVSVPLVLAFHGGGGSGEQLELRSSGMNDVADREGFVVVYPDGTGTIRTWNAGGCCGAAVRDDVDDVGFVTALLDHLEGALCIDTAGVFAAGMSNGAMLTHRLACELSDRLAAIAPVAGLNVASVCESSDRVAILEIHGTADGHVPWEGGLGCGPAGVAFPSVDDTIAAWRARNGCSSDTSVWATQGDGTCNAYMGCEGDVVLCAVEGGGHSWPGGLPPADVVDCPADGPQSTTFFASEQIWRFFDAHPRR